MPWNWEHPDWPDFAWDNAALMYSATTKDLNPAKPRTLWRATTSGGPVF